MSRLSAQEILSAIASGDFLGDSVRVLILAAHPDDETISASAVLGRVEDRTIIYLTDGAPRDPQFRSPHVSGSREMYALVRAEEAACALALLGVPASRISFLNAVDQEAIFEAKRLTQEFIDAAQRIRPDVIITHPYEGGHPDHDTAALVARLAVSELQRRDASPALMEFTSYHSSDGSRRSGMFLSPSAGVACEEDVRLTLSPEERSRKARMLGCYVSQWHVLSEFPLEPERLRIAPSYDFASPAHPGLLWYECLRWPLSGQKWRDVAAEIASERGTAACR
jgi:LmbE family N-acetylglucosaminyl deacetylase